jgi:hypothetical protein
MSRKNMINKFLKNVKTVDKKSNALKYLEEYQELEGFTFVNNLDEFKDLPYGIIIRYVNFDGDLKWGGIYLKYWYNNDKHHIYLANKSFNKYHITFENNYIYYKKPETESDKIRKLFISYIK